MKPNKVRVPTLILHKASGRDVVFLRQPDGSRRMVYLGLHGSPESARAYRDVIAAHFAGRAVTTPARAQSPSDWPTVGQLVSSYLLHCDRYYVDGDGTRSKGVVNVVHAMRPFVDHLRDEPTDRLSIGSLGNVRQALIDAGRCNRATINAKMRRVRQCLRWGVEQRLVPGAVWHEVSAMKGIPAGRGGVRESKVVEAVPWSMVEPLQAHLPSPLWAAVLVQWWAGLRPGEVLQLTRARIEACKEGDVELWRYRPARHKGQWREQERVVVIGPHAQEALRPFLKLDPDAAIISPLDAIAEQKARKRASRKTPMTPSQRARARRNAAKAPPVGEFYSVASYRKAIHRACDEAGVPRWSPHRLRHACGTRLYLTGGIEHARVALGHRDTRVTRRYSVAADTALASEVMGQHG